MIVKVLLRMAEEDRDGQDGQHQQSPQFTQNIYVCLVDIKSQVTEADAKELKDIQINDRATTRSAAAYRFISFEEWKMTIF